MQSECEYIVWDSSVIIDAIQKTEERFSLIQPFIKSAESGNLTIVVSEISIAEVTYIDKKRREQNKLPTSKEVKMIEEWFENEYVDRRIVHPGISELARSFVRMHNIKTMDALIAATAVFYKIPLLHTFDGYKKDKNTKSKKNNLLNLDGMLGYPALRITPPNYDDGLLWETTLENDNESIEVKIKEVSNDSDQEKM